MRVWYDCEFLEDGRTIELISIGMVAEDGRELYAVAREIEERPLYQRICRHDWLMAHVVPHLPLSREYDMPFAFALDPHSAHVMPRLMIRNAVHEFILGTPDPELWAWYGAYDHVALAQLFGTMVNLPDGIPMWTNDLRQEQHRLGDPPLPKQDGGEHNAIADARHLKVMHEALTGVGVS